MYSFQYEKIFTITNNHALENACTVFSMKKFLLSQTIMHWKMHVQFIVLETPEFLLFIFSVSHKEFRKLHSISRICLNCLPITNSFKLILTIESKYLWGYCCITRPMSGHPLFGENSCLVALSKVATQRVYLS